MEKPHHDLFSGVCLIIIGCDGSFGRVFDVFYTDQIVDPNFTTKKIIHRKKEKNSVDAMTPSLSNHMLSYCVGVRASVRRVSTNNLRTFYGATTVVQKPLRTIRHRVKNKQDR